MAAAERAVRLVRRVIVVLIVLQVLLNQAGCLGEEPLIFMYLAICTGGFIKLLFALESYSAEHPSPEAAQPAQTSIPEPPSSSTAPAKPSTPASSNNKPRCDTPRRTRPVKFVNGRWVAKSEARPTAGTPAVVGQSAPAVAERPAPEEKSEPSREEDKPN